MKVKQFLILFIFFIFIKCMPCIREFSNNYDNNYQVNNLSNGLNHINKKFLNILVKKWAPLVWLAPGEKFMPLSVKEFLNNVHTENLPQNKLINLLKKHKKSNNFKNADNDDDRSYLVTNLDIEKLLYNMSSFLYGKNPMKFSVPIYATVKLCDTNDINDINDVDIDTDFQQKKEKTLYIPVSAIDDYEENSIFPKVTKQKRSIEPIEDDTMSKNVFITNNAHNIKFTATASTNHEIDINDDEIIEKEEEDKEEISIENFQKNVPSFHVTYWMFYPYSQGKSVCTLNLGPLGRIPIPSIFGKCLGSKKNIGNHIGDWEHMSLLFTNSNTYYLPKMMYVSAHDAGAYYSYNHLTGTFEFKRQETRKGLLQNPTFPKTVITILKNHPVLFAALGSHGLWTAPGKHRFVRVARLYDINGFGTPWYTWKAINIFYQNLNKENTPVPEWLQFKGKWGNPKSKCHPLKRIGLNFCEYTDGPNGILANKEHFQC